MCHVLLVQFKLHILLLGFGNPLRMCIFVKKSDFLQLSHVLDYGRKVNSLSEDQKIVSLKMSFLNTHVSPILSFIGFISFMLLFVPRGLQAAL